MNINDNDLVFNINSEGEINSAGYSIENNLLKNGESPMTTLNDKCGGSITKNLSDLAVPTGLYILNNSINKPDIDTSEVDTSEVDTNEIDTISESLYSKLLNLAKFKEKKKTRKHISKKTRTRKNKSR